ncbi:MAG TPA: hypothetical protein PK640_15600, partial [Verrucomicrobiota bacterium]|nr:hypothetical protein [Verrucomicrobiota bacterium]
DGMMNDVRDPGHRLPGRSIPAKRRKVRTYSVNNAAGMQTHPYSIAVSLGKQIRFSAPLEQIAAELEPAAPKYLAQERP